MSGRSGYRGDGEPGEDPPYSRVTNPERFLPLHTAALEIIGRLESDFEVERSEGYGLDEEMERGLDTARPGVKLIPSDPEAAPLAVVFTTFPGLHIRFGRWYGKPFPGRGRDESAEGGIERLKDMVNDVTSGRFRESIEIPRLSYVGSGWVEARLWSPDDGGSSTMSRSTSRVDRVRALEMSGGRSRLELDWRPWPRRQSPHGSTSGSHT